jgi:hypothetical protein
MGSGVRAEERKDKSKAGRKKRKCRLNLMGHDDPSDSPI